MNSRRALALLILVAIASVAWIAFESPKDTRGAANASVVKSTPPDARVETEEPPRIEESVREVRESERESVPTSSNASSATQVSTEVMLRGFVRPAVGRDGFVQVPRVTATDHLGARTGSDPHIDGAYAISGLSPGRLWVRADSTDDGNARAVIDVVEAAIPAQLDLQLVLPTEVVVNVRDDSGQPVRLGDPFTLGVLATREVPGEWIELARDDPDRSLGQYVPSTEHYSDPASACIGRLRFDGEPPPFVSLVRYQRVIATQRIGPGDRVVEFVVDAKSRLLQPSGVRLRLVDARTKSPIAGATVHFDAAGNAMGRTDQDGVFAMRSCGPGWATLRVSCKGFESGERRFHVEPGVENDFGDIELGEGQWIAGNVLDESGVGVSTELRYDLLDPVTLEARSSGTVFICKSDADGSFRISGVSPGSYRVSVTGKNEAWGVCTATVDTRGGPVEQVTLRVVRGTPLILHLQNPDSRSVRFKILDRSGSTVLASRLWSQDPSKFLLAPGTYDLELRARNTGARTLIPLTIANDPVELALP
jgi:hypothetical protein